MKTITTLARDLNVHPSTIHRRISRLGIEPARFGQLVFLTDPQIELVSKKQKPGPKRRLIDRVELGEILKGK